MKLNENEIKTKLESVTYKSATSSLPFYSLKDVLKEFDLDLFDLGVISATSMRKILDEELSYPCKLSFQFKNDSTGKTQDVYLNKMGLMLVFAKLATLASKIQDKELCYNIAKLVKKEERIFYPERRLYFRREYKQSFKILSSKIKYLVENGYIKSNQFMTLQRIITQVHFTILSDYYFVTKVSNISLKKTGNSKKNYLDYITYRELKDLTYINNALIKAIEKDPFVDLKNFASVEAWKKRKEFFSNYAGMYPYDYRSHSNTPLKMVKAFDALLAELKLDDKHILDEKNTYDK